MQTSVIFHGFFVGFVDAYGCILKNKNITLSVCPKIGAKSIPYYPESILNECLDS